MYPEVTLISATNIDWNIFVRSIDLTIGRSPTRQLDVYGIEVGSPKSYLAALGEIKRPGSNPIEIIRDNDEVLNFIHYTFLVSCNRDTLYELLEYHDFGLRYFKAPPGKNRENFILVGSLKTWRDLIINLSNPEADCNIRLFCAEVWNILEKQGLREIFTNYQRKALKDKTFILEYKK